MRTAGGVVTTPQDVFQIVAADLAGVEDEINLRARSAVPLVDEIARYLHAGGGKRLRPALLLLSSRLCGFEGRAAVELGAVVELIHVATLVHDDIIDNASVRRGRPSVNARWDNSVTVLMGDWLYMTSFQTASGLRDFRILDLLSEVTREMIEGELMQLEQAGRLDTSVSKQLDIASRKTACLFAGCGRLGAILAGTGNEQEESLHNYGRAVGLAFQLTDDLLDYSSRQDVLGKPVLKDLEEGKVTLPLVFALQKAGPQDRQFLQRVVRNGELSPSDKQQVLELVGAHGALEDVRRLARQFSSEAKACLTAFPDSPYRQALAKVPDFVTNRDK
jgi:octaprenyl-diphosphate synthase